MIFVTVGSRNFAFNRLLIAIDKAVSTGEITDKIFAQIGSSDFTPQHYKFVRFLNHIEFDKYMNECDTVITHGGTGVIVNAIKLGKRVIAVPRLAKFGEAVDDHQMELIRKFTNMNMLTACYDCDVIGNCVKESNSLEILQYESNTNQIIDSIERFLDKNKFSELDESNSNAD